MKYLRLTVVLISFTFMHTGCKHEHQHETLHKRQQPTVKDANKS